MKIAEKTMDVIRRTERVATFIETNCHQMKMTIISAKDLNDIIAIINEEVSESLMDDKESLSRHFNKSLYALSKKVIIYLSSIVDTPTSTTKSKRSINRYIKTFINSNAKMFHISANEFVMNMLMK